MKATKWQVVVVLSLAAVLCGASGHIAAQESEDSAVIQMVGSTTVGPIADAYAEYFKDKGIKISVTKNGSGDGAKALVDGLCDIADMSRFMKEKEFKAAVENGVMPVAHVMAMDGVCVIVHPSNPVKALTTEQIRNIYKGEITNWKELGGADQNIVVISRDTNSGTYETFEGLVMNKEKMAGSVEYVASNPHAKARVESTPGAVAYVGLGFVDNKVVALTVDGIAPNRKTIAAGVYPVSRPLFFFTNGYPKLGSKVFTIVTFHLTEEGQKIIEEKGFVPVTSY
jgi:phosphate transport system substrate-binding protein